MPLLLTQQISNEGGPAPRWVLAQLFWGGCDAPDQVLGAGAGAEVWDAPEKWEWARLYLHFTHVTKQTRGPRAELGGALSPAIPGDMEQFLGPGVSPCPGDSCWRAAQPAWWGSGLAEDPPDPQIFGFAKNLRQSWERLRVPEIRSRPLCVCLCAYI